MKRMSVGLAVVGGGPAGLAAAVEASKLGMEDILILERDYRLGGILNQCVHDGFGVVKFGKRLTGGQYAGQYIREARERKIASMVDTMVLEITEDRRIYAVNGRDGMCEIDAAAIVLAMGCRERSRSQAMIPGTRPAGVYTAGMVQRLINVEGYLPGSRAVILGSGDIGLIMARRMSIEGIPVEGVYEIMPHEGGLTRNIEQCLRDYGIPLHLSSTVTKILGRERVEGVEVARVDAAGRPVRGTERVVACDLVVLSVGLIPENELSVGAGVELDPATKGPYVDETMMTNVPGVFCAGNAVAVFDLVDYVSRAGEIAAKGAADFAQDGRRGAEWLRVSPGDDVALALPQRVSRGGASGEIEFFMRVKRKIADAEIVAESGGKSFTVGRERAVKPAEMVVCKVKRSEIGEDGLILHARGRDA